MPPSLSSRFGAEIILVSISVCTHLADLEHYFCIMTYTSDKTSILHIA